MAPMASSDKMQTELLSSLALTTVLPSPARRRSSLSSPLIQQQDLGRLFPFVLVPEEKQSPLQALASALQRVQGLAKSAVEDARGAVEKAVLGEDLAEVLRERRAAGALARTRPRRSMRPVSALHGHNFAAIIPGDGVAEQVVTSSIFNFLNIYNTLLVGRLVLTWFPNPPEIIANPLSTICDPYLNLFRGIIPPIGGTIDLSPILAFLALNVFTNAASALPAEMPEEELGAVYQEFTPAEASKPTGLLTWRQKAAAKKGFKPKQ